ncbi:NTP transferase domain-containing protein [Nocardia puris]|uniref:NTP transferase domain-containing protein n=1 Tax=Nocardia puris TaxID=208602 RepID=UPI0018959F92|nr:NTP transferase domain-containing protein [Nocardia puris]MBF6211099.1 NTP transferase domain-containing protein [Nocardia puris]MBF6364690.1 NTP transferase domain-containing protein [Nocardia puris]MBF6463118.1 NTP transferase domain-containing protein [Nocardia puris]
MTVGDAIVLAGGRASRMGGVDKPALVIGGRSMLEAALSAAAGCARIVVVGPHRPELAPEIGQVRETPAGAGPVAAVDAGLRELADSDAPHVLVLAADMPFLSRDTVDELFGHAAESGADAVFAADGSGRPQYLIGVWRRDALKSALAELDSPINQPMKVLVPPHTATITLADIDDCDTEDDVREARERIADTAPLALSEARKALREKLSPLAPERRPLRDARGAALAASVLAESALPRFDVSAMDGYAVSGDGPWKLRRDIGFAGGERPAGLQPGEAVRIATGAHVPDGATTVLRDEFADVRTDHTLHRVPDTPIRDDVRRRGEDRVPGDVVAPEGTPVTPALISAAASVEVTEGEVRGPLRARIVMTGDEIRGEGPLQTGQTRDSIGPILPDLLTRCGVQAADRVHLRDTARGFDEVLAAATDCDLLVVVGATGGGAADQLRGALSRTGARVVVPRLRLRPGGSTVIAETSGSTTVLGLPGNPFAAVATLLALTPAIVEGRTRAHPGRPFVGPLHNASDISGPVARVVPARIAPAGGWIGDPGVRTAHLGGLVDRDGLVIVPPDAADGTLVEFLPLPR